MCYYPMLHLIFMSRMCYEVIIICVIIICGVLFYILDNLELFTWGKNKTGYLGLGHVQDQFFPIKVTAGHIFS